MYTTCSTNELKMFTNTSGNYHEKPDLNEPKIEKEKNFLYYLPIKLFKRVHFILKSQPATLKGKIRFLKKIEKVLLSEVGKYKVSSNLEYDSLESIAIYQIK